MEDEYPPKKTFVCPNCGLEQIRACPLPSGNLCNECQRPMDVVPKYTAMSLFSDAVAQMIPECPSLEDERIRNAVLPLLHFPKGCDRDVALEIVKAQLRHRLPQGDA